MTVDVEDWYHILDSPAVPSIVRWRSLECRVERNMERLLDLFDRTGTRATFFWLGWLAERHQGLVRRCRQAGHEIASHGYGHVLAGQVGPRAFRNDVVRARAVLEDITGAPVPGFRAAGFGLTDHRDWAFDVIRQAGHQYDSSVLPAGRGGANGTPLSPHVIHTESGALTELPISVVRVLDRRLTLFGGGYLRLAPRPLIEWGIARLRAAGRPLIVYVHPREIDPDHPRLPLSAKRRFKCYVNLRTTLPKLTWLCNQVEFRTAGELAAATRAPEGLERVVHPRAA